MSYKPILFFIKEEAARESRFRDLILKYIKMIEGEAESSNPDMEVIEKAIKNMYLLLNSNPY